MTLSADGGSFINDVIVTDNGAFFTDSFKAQLYKVPLTSEGYLADGADTVPETIPLSGFPVVDGSFNANGIEASDDGETLIVANSQAGELYIVDPATGDSFPMDLNGTSITGDGLLRRRNTLWVVSNGSSGGPQMISEIHLSADFSCGFVSPRKLISDLFDIPTTAARKYNGIYVVNAKFGTPANETSSTSYEIIRVNRDEGEYICSS